MPNANGLKLMELKTIKTDTMHVAGNCDIFLDHFYFSP